jgi:hypothetical protein
MRYASFTLFDPRVPFALTAHTRRTAETLGNPKYANEKVVKIYLVTNASVKM